MQSVGLHLAVVMDGNGRWATRRGLPRAAGHVAGIAALRRVVEAAPALGVATLSVFAFSSDNWRRPPAEVAALMVLLGDYLGSDAPRLVEAGVRLTVIGRRDRLAPQLVAGIEAAEAATSRGRTLHLRVAVDYSARDAIVAAASSHPGNREALAATLGRGEPACDVDLLVRTGGERRLSDFLLWECAYAELLFTDEPWPDFDDASLARALADFRARTRRYGGLPGETVASQPATPAPGSAHLLASAA